jgi:hypothetical protein
LGKIGSGLLWLFTGQLCWNRLDRRFISVEWHGGQLQQQKRNSSSQEGNECKQIKKRTLSGAFMLDDLFMVKASYKLASVS